MRKQLLLLIPVLFLAACAGSPGPSSSIGASMSGCPCCQKMMKEGGGCGMMKEGMMKDGKMQCGAKMMGTGKDTVMQMGDQNVSVPVAPAVPADEMRDMDRVQKEMTK